MEGKSQPTSLVAVCFLELTFPHLYSHFLRSDRSQGDLTIQDVEETLPTESLRRSKRDKEPLAAAVLVGAAVGSAATTVSSGDSTEGISNRRSIASGESVVTEVISNRSGNKSLVPPQSRDVEDSEESSASVASSNKEASRK